MKVELSPGDSVKIGFAETDGEFEIHFDTKDHPLCVIVKETAGLPGSVKGRANEVLYEERFEAPSHGQKEVPAVDPNGSADHRDQWDKGR